MPTTTTWRLCHVHSAAVHPAVQECNPRLGLAQAGMVAAYCMYLIVSAVSNYGHGMCNPLSRACTTWMTTSKRLLYSRVHQVDERVNGTFGAGNGGPPGPPGPGIGHDCGPLALGTARENAGEPGPLVPSGGCIPCPHGGYGAL